MQSQNPPFSYFFIFFISFYFFFRINFFICSVQNVRTKKTNCDMFFFLTWQRVDKMNTQIHTNTKTKWVNTRHRDLTIHYNHCFDISQNLGLSCFLVSTNRKLLEMTEIWENNTQETFSCLLMKYFQKNHQLTPKNKRQIWVVFCQNSNVFLCSVCWY